MKEYDYTFVDNSDKALQELAEKSDVILEAWGLEGERHAKELVRTDTGLLKNSITHAVAGESAAISSYRADNPDVSGNINTGEYSGTTEKQGDEKAVYIGSNVSYAIPVETGHIKPDGTFTAPHPYLKPAIENHVDEYKAIVKKYLSK